MDICPHPQLTPGMAANVAFDAATRQAINGPMKFSRESIDLMYTIMFFKADLANENNL